MTIEQRANDIVRRAYDAFYTCGRDDRDDEKFFDFVYKHLTECYREGVLDVAGLSAESGGVH